jgi:sugar lactone lactonase YvrE/pimeloyl-ACP methyl ester carboxylesterase
MRNHASLLLTLPSLALLSVAGVWPAFSQTSPSYAWTTFVGQLGGPGNVDGAGSAARFHQPYGVAVDSAGNLFVADADNFTIRKVTPAGVVTTLAGSAGNPGSADGTGSAARFYCPEGIAVDSGGNLFVADTGSPTIRKVTSAGVVTTLAGSAGPSGSADGTGSAARFFDPVGVAVDSVGNVFVADYGNNTIRKVTAAGVVTTLAGSAGSSGSADGTGSTARFFWPSGVALDSAGSLLVADWANNTIRKVTAAGVVTTLAGSAGSSGSADGTGSAARFSGPEGLAVDSADNVFVADEGNDTIRKVTWAGVVTTLAGSALAQGSADGTGSAARFFQPEGVAVDGVGDVFVADFFNSTIRKVTSAGLVTTLAGSAGNFGSADGTGSAARFFYPQGLAVGSAGNVFVADTQNHTIRKVTLTGVVTTLAGKAGNSGTADGTGSAARFCYPAGLAVDSAGNAFVADNGNNTIRKVTAAGVVTTLAGRAGYSGCVDGTGSAARFNLPSGVAADGAGNLLVADTDNCTIRKVTPTGVVTTLAGNAGNSGSADGTGSAARFCYPVGVAVDSAGNVFVADYGNDTIRQVTPTGVVTTIGGTAGFMSGADGSGRSALFAKPFGIAVDCAGNLFVEDTYNNAIRQGWPTSGGAGVTIIVPPQSLVTNAGATVTFSVSATGTGQLSYQWLFNGTDIPGATDVTLSLTDAQLASAGDYGVVVTSSFGSVASAAAQLILLAQTNRQATVAEIGQSTIDPNSQLQVYTNGAFKSNVGLDPNKMTIVLTHGWNSSFGDWPAAMAALFVLGSRTPTPNIVAWDWQKDAKSDLLHIYVPVGNIPKQGDALGKELLAQLGPNYSQPIHFIGHSFGTLVNARAADYLHGDGPCVPCRPAKGVDAFLPANTQMTLFDEAELAPDLMNDVLAATEAIITGVPMPIQPFYGSAMPKQSRWADNYISAVGLLHLDAANVIFTRGLPGLEADFAAWSSAVTAFHGYPYGWYELTVPVCSAGLMGDQWSFEQSGFASAPATSSVFLQTAGVSPLDLAPTDMLSGAAVVLARFEEEAASLGIAAGGSVVNAVVQVSGQVLGSVGSDLSSLYVRLQTGLGGLFGPNGLPPNFPKGGGGGGGTNAPACAWIPLSVPSNAVSMSFNFMVQGDGQDDSFAVALGGTNVLSLAMGLIQTNVTLSSGLIRVSPWAGQTVELFLGIVGGTSTNASLTVGGISFYGVVPPSLQAQASGSNLVVTWPVSADGYALETSTSLTGTNSWAPVTNVPAIVNFQNTVTNEISAGSRFYRLNKAP